jgi:hypothetical protein
MIDAWLIFSDHGIVHTYIQHEYNLNSYRKLLRVKINWTTAVQENVKLHCPISYSTDRIHICGLVGYFLRLSQRLIQGIPHSLQSTLHSLYVYTIRSVNSS